MEGDKYSVFFPVINFAVGLLEWWLSEPRTRRGTAREQNKHSSSIRTVSQTTSEWPLWGLIFKLFIKIPAEEFCIGSSPIYFLLSTAQKTSVLIIGPLKEVLKCY